MNPWDIIGWVIIAAIIFLVLVPILASVIVVVIGYVMVGRRHRRTRNTPPERGQEWSQRGDSIYIDRVFDDGRVVIRTSFTRGGSGAMWSETPEDWRKRVRNTRAYLVKSWGDGLP